MKHAGSVLMRNAPALGRAASRRSGRKSLFMRILAALRHSRELEAGRVYRRYRHLIAKPAEPAVAAPDFNQEGNADAHRDNAPLRVDRAPECG